MKINSNGVSEALHFLCRVADVSLRGQVFCSVGKIESDLMWSSLITTHRQRICKTAFLLGVQIFSKISSFRVQYVFLRHSPRTALVQLNSSTSGHFRLLLWSTKIEHAAKRLLPCIGHVVLRKPFMKFYYSFLFVLSIRTENILILKCFSKCIQSFKKTNEANKPLEKTSEKNPYILFLNVSH